MVELLDTLIDQCGRGLLVGHGNPATEEHLELFGEGVVELGGATQLFLTGNLSCLPDGADDLRHLCKRGYG